MKHNPSTWLAVSLLLLGQAAGGTAAARAGSFDLKDTASTSESKAIVGTKDVGEGNFGRQRFTLTFDTRFGYDDNSLAQPDSIRVVSNQTGKVSTVNVNTSDSAFFNFSLGVGYTAATPRLSLTLGADIGVNYYFDRPGRSYDVNGGLSLRVTYKLAPRAFLDFSSYNAYESQGDYGATNLTGFTGAVAPGSTPGTSAQRNGDYFYTTNRIALTYQFAPRLSAVFSNNLVAFAYDNEPYATVQDRIEGYVGAELQYLLQPNLTLAADYRFGYINYFSVNNDSQTHFLLGGADYSFNPRLRGSIRAGVEFRTYFDSPGDETSPYAEANLTYDVSRYSHLSLTSRYSIEEGDLSVNNSKADTFRIGINFEQEITRRISAYAGFYYTHSYYQNQGSLSGLTAAARNGLNGVQLVVFDANAALSPNNFNEDTYDASLGLRYAINRHASVEFGYTHTTVDSEFNGRAYDRNRYFGGLRLQF